MADIVLYRIPVGEVAPELSGVEQIGYADNFFIVSVPSLEEIPVPIKEKYGIRRATEQVARGIKFFIALPNQAKLYKGYSSGEGAQFINDDFDQQIGIRVNRPMTESEIVDRYEAIRFIRIELVKDYYKQKFTSLSVNKTEQERATFAIQEAEARAFVEDANSPTTHLTILAEARGETVSQLATKVIAASDAYKLEVVNLLAQQESYITALKNAQGNDILNVELPVERTIVPGDSRYPNPTS